MPGQGAQAGVNRLRLRLRLRRTSLLTEQVAAQAGLIKFLENRNGDLQRDLQRERTETLRSARRVTELEEQIRALLGLLRARAEIAIGQYPAKIHAQIRSDLATLEHSDDLADRAAALASLEHHARSRPAVGLLDLAAGLTTQRRKSTQE